MKSALNLLLPQTQCTKCGYQGCEPYAGAIAAGEADINRCIPGGDPVIAELAVAMGLPGKPLDTRYGQPAPLRVAVIDERYCIGCTLCIQACPVDAIAGASKFMHTVIPPLCTGCDLCVDPCPVDCISMEAPPAEWSTWTRQRAAAARRRYEARNERLAVRRRHGGGAFTIGGRKPRAAPEDALQHGAPAPASDGPAAPATLPEQPPGVSASARRVLIAAAVARVRARRQA